MKKAIVLMFVFAGLSVISQAQTTLIEWQTNWPQGTAGAALASNINFSLPGSSCWFASSQTALVGTNGGVAGAKTNLVATIPSGSLTYWTYFASSNKPVSLVSNTSLRVSVDFNVSNSVAQNNSRGLRIGLLYSGTNNGVGQTFWNGSGYTPTGAPKQTNSYGYSQMLNFGTTFGVEPLQTYAFTNGLPVSNTDSVLSKTSDGVPVGGNGGGTTNDPAFLDFTNYTLVITVTNINPTNVTITTTISGPGLSNSVDHTAGYITQTVVDTNYCYTNFDTVCFRPAGNTSVSTLFTITSFKVEVVTNTVSPGAPVLNHTLQGSTLTLSWKSQFLGWYLQSQTNALYKGLGANWITIPGTSLVTTTNQTVSPGNPAVFYRLSQNP